MPNETLLRITRKPLTVKPTVADKTYKRCLRRFAKYLYFRRSIGLLPGIRGYSAHTDGEYEGLCFGPKEHDPLYDLTLPRDLRDLEEVIELPLPGLDFHTEVIGAFCEWAELGGMSDIISAEVSGWTCGHPEFACGQVSYRMTYFEFPEDRRA